MNCFGKSTVQIYPSRRWGGKTHAFDGEHLESLAIATASFELGLRFARKDLRKIIPSIAKANNSQDEAHGVENLLRNFRFRPDGYAVTWGADKQHARSYGRVFDLWFLEIEDTSRLSLEKLRALCELWFDFDCTDSWNLHLWLTDRYGRGEEFNLCNPYYISNFAEV